MGKAERNYLIDNLKVLLIFFVVFGHVIEYYIQGNSVLMGLYLFIYFFHMPLFVFVSGYLSKNVDKCRQGAVKSLLVPYIVFNIIWYLLAYLATGELMLLIIYPGWTLWYLISLFFWRVMLKYLVRIKYILPISILCGLLIGIIPSGGGILSLSRTISFLPFFLAGYYTSEKGLSKIAGISKKYALLGLVVAVIIAFYLGGSNALDYNFLYHSQSYSYSGFGIYEGILFKGMIYIGAASISICLLNLIPHKKLFFTKVGKQTMNVYLFHPYLTIGVYAIIHVLKLLSFNVLGHAILLISPVAIIYLLTRKVTERVYNGIFYPVNKIIYYPRFWKSCKKQCSDVKPKMISLRRILLGF